MKHLDIAINEHAPEYAQPAEFLDLVGHLKEHLQTFQREWADSETFPQILEVIRRLSAYGQKLPLQPKGAFARPCGFLEASIKTATNGIRMLKNISFYHRLPTVERHKEIKLVKITVALCSLLSSVAEPSVFYEVEKFDKDKNFVGKKRPLNRLDEFLSSEGSYFLIRIVEPAPLERYRSYASSLMYRIVPDELLQMLDDAQDKSLLCFLEAYVCRSYQQAESANPKLFGCLSDAVMHTQEQEFITCATRLNSVPLPHLQTELEILLARELHGKWSVGRGGIERNRLLVIDDGELWLRYPEGFEQLAKVAQTKWPYSEIPLTAQTIFAYCSFFNIIRLSPNSEVERKLFIEEKEDPNNKTGKQNPQKEVLAPAACIYKPERFLDEVSGWAHLLKQCRPELKLEKKIEDESLKFNIILEEDKKRSDQCLSLRSAEEKFFDGSTGPMNRFFRKLLREIKKEVDKRDLEQRKKDPKIPVVEAKRQANEQRAVSDKEALIGMLRENVARKNRFPFQEDRQAAAELASEGLPLRITEDREDPASDGNGRTAKNGLGETRLDTEGLNSGKTCDYSLNLFAGQGKLGASNLPGRQTAAMNTAASKQTKSSSGAAPAETAKKSRPSTGKATGTANAGNAIQMTETTGKEVHSDKAGNQPAPTGTKANPDALKQAVRSGTKTSMEPSGCPEGGDSAAPAEKPSKVKSLFLAIRKVLGLLNPMKPAAVKPGSNDPQEASSHDEAKPNAAPKLRTTHAAKPVAISPDTKFGTESTVDYTDESLFAIPPEEKLTFMPDRTLEKELCRLADEKYERQMAARKLKAAKKAEAAKAAAAVKAVSTTEAKLQNPAATDAVPAPKKRATKKKTSEEGSANTVPEAVAGSSALPAQEKEATAAAKKRTRTKKADPSAAEGIAVEAKSDGGSTVADSTGVPAPKKRAPTKKTGTEQKDQVLANPTLMESGQDKTTISSSSCRETAELEKTRDIPSGSDAGTSAEPAPKPAEPGVGTAKTKTAKDAAPKQRSAGGKNAVQTDAVGSGSETVGSNKASEDKTVGKPAAKNNSATAKAAPKASAGKAEKPKASAASKPASKGTEAQAAAKLSSSSPKAKPAATKANAGKEDPGGQAKKAPSSAGQKKDSAQATKPGKSAAVTAKNAPSKPSGGGQPAAQPKKKPAVKQDPSKAKAQIPPDPGESGGQPAGKTAAAKKQPSAEGKENPPETGAKPQRQATDKA